MNSSTCNAARSIKIEGKDIRDLQIILGHDNVYDTKKLFGEAMKKNISAKCHIIFD